ncbi:MAG: hypothetical protein IT423_00615 [Pirellulaceae bacterium]|nr:hypothetical protein [Pirellulaceae bacterium]
MSIDRGHGTSSSPLANSNGMDVRTVEKLVSAGASTSRMPLIAIDWRLAHSVCDMQTQTAWMVGRLGNLSPQERRPPVGRKSRLTGHGTFGLR